MRNYETVKTLISQFLRFSKSFSDSHLLFRKTIRDVHMLRKNEVRVLSREGKQRRVYPMQPGVRRGGREQRRNDTPFSQSSQSYQNRERGQTETQAVATQWAR